MSAFKVCNVHNILQEPKYWDIYSKEMAGCNNSNKLINSDIFNPSPDWSAICHLMPEAQLAICGQKPNWFEVWWDETLQKRVGIHRKTLRRPHCDLRKTFRPYEHCSNNDHLIKERVSETILQRDSAWIDILPYAHLAEVPLIEEFSPQIRAKITPVRTKLPFWGEKLTILAYFHSNSWRRIAWE